MGAIPGAVHASSHGIRVHRSGPLKNSERSHTQTVGEDFRRPRGGVGLRFVGPQTDRCPSRPLATGDLMVAATGIPSMTSRNRHFFTSSQDQVTSGLSGTWSLSKDVVREASRDGALLSPLRMSHRYSPS